MEGSKHGGEAHMLHTLEEDVQHVEEHVLPLPPRNEPSRKGGDLYSGGLALNPTHDGGRRNSDYLNEDEDDFFHPSDEDADSAGSTGSMSSWSDEDEEDRGAFVEFIVRRIEAPKDTWNALPEAVALHEELPPPVKLRRSVYGLPLVPPYHPVCLAWLGGMLLFDIVYTAFWVPLSIGFCTSREGTDLSTGCVQADFFGGLVYTINFLLAFQWGAVVTYDDQDVQVLDSIRLMRLYVKHGRFVIDVLAVIPFIVLVVLIPLPDSVGVSLYWITFLNLLRMVRLLRLVSISKVVSITSKSKAGAVPVLSITTVYIIMLAYMMMVVINFEACIMLFIAHIEGLENSWMAAFQIADGGWINLPTATQPQQWYTAVYWVITTSTTTGYGDITPRSVAEQVVANLYMIFGLVFFGLLVGTISNVTTRASNKAHKLHVFRKKIGRVSEWLHDNHVPEQTRKQVKTYFTQVWATREDITLDAEIFNDLPHYLRHQLAAYVMMRPVASLRLFKTQDTGLQRLIAQYMRPVDSAPGSDLCQQGEEGDRLWIMTEGRVDALQHLAPPLHLTSPCVIGDSVIVAEDIPSFRLRAFTVRTLNQHICKVWELRVSSLWPILSMYPNLRTDAMEHIRNRTLVDLAAGMVGGPASRGAARGGGGGRAGPASVQHRGSSGRTRCSAAKHAVRNTAWRCACGTRGCGAVPPTELARCRGCGGCSGCCAAQRGSGAWPELAW
uniref:Cyclic nucleotide-binding domain-containing protein n=1 Tax=Chlamydomonas euryale TaxID=1486919 RepID=A0A7R9Z6P8_9CHLO|mmetsp:Transcript_5137/g.15592  ORF Transcript_5137/g.15592 Transcript_5137/m.15592 type:complete len:724 (+) Transcript_5137:714-2885(+)